MRKFNTIGPCFPNEHYMLPALDRLPGVRELVTDGKYFVVHAPRQTGKTTALKALGREVNDKGDVFALYCTLESLQNMSEPDKSNVAIRDLIADNAEMSPFYKAVSGAPELRSDRGGIGLCEEHRKVCGNTAWHQDCLSRRYGSRCRARNMRASGLLGHVMLVKERQRQ